MPPDQGRQNGDYYERKSYSGLFRRTGHYGTDPMAERDLWLWSHLLLHQLRTGKWTGWSWRARKAFRRFQIIYWRYYRWILWRFHHALRKSRRRLWAQIPARNLHGPSGNRQKAGGNRPQRRRYHHLPRRNRQRERPDPFWIGHQGTGSGSEDRRTLAYDRSLENGFPWGWDRLL